MTHLLDNNYHKALLYDESKTEPRNVNLSTIVNDKILNTEELCNHIKDVIQFPQCSKTKQRRKYTRQMPFYIEINVQPSNFFVQCQIILAIHQNIPIILQKPRIIYWNNQIYQSKGRKSRFQCWNCKAAIKYNEQNNCIYTQDLINHGSKNCENKDYKYELINKLLLLELKHNIQNEPCLNLITPSMHYARITSKYKYKFPCMDLKGFPPFNIIQSNLYKQKSNTTKLTSSDITHYFHDKFNTTLQQFCNSPCMRIEYEKTIKYWIKNNSLLFTTTKLLDIFFGALAVGGDGTFNIIPQFRNQSGGRIKHHDQVFKIYAFYRYKTKNNNFRIISYLIGFALLEKKDADIYKWMYGCIFEYGQVNGFIGKVDIKQYICDFEEAQRIGFRYIFDGETGIIISGEEFHFKQALCGNIVKKELSKFYIQKKDSIHYDRKFRIHIEALYNLLHIHHSTVQNIAIKICQSLWFYSKNQWNCGHSIKCVLNYIVYFLYGYCELDKDNIIKELKCKGKQITFIKERRPKKIESIINWNINNKPVNTSNSIEVNNKHHRMKLGYYPTIDEFIKQFLQIFDENIKAFNYNEQVKILPNQQQSKGLIKKRKFLEKHKDDRMDFEQYKLFSAKLTYIKYQMNGKNINKWLFGNDDINNNCITKTKYSFNDVIQISNSDNTDNSVNVFNTNDSTDINDEDYIPKPIFSNNNKQTNNSDKHYGFRKRKRKCVEILQKNKYRPYLIYGSESENEDEWNTNMRNKNQYHEAKKLKTA